MSYPAHWRGSSEAIVDRCRAAQQRRDHENGAA